MKHATLVWFGMVLLLLVACESTPPAITIPAEDTLQPAVTMTATTAATEKAPTFPSPPGTSVPGPSPTTLVPDGPAAMAIQDLAQRLNVAPEEIEVVSVVDEDFPAGDLGCPSPKQPTRPSLGLVTGKEITLSVSGTFYRYRAHGGQIVFCDS